MTKARPSTRAKWRALRSAGISTLEKVFDSADIVRDGMLQQLSEVSADSGKLHAGWLQRRASLSIVEPCCPVASHDAEGTRRYSEAHKRIVDVI